MSTEASTREPPSQPRTEGNSAEASFLTDDFLRQVMNVGEVDILVGLPTHNNAKTVGPIVEAVRAGILKWFPRERAVIINADGGSRDGTPDIVTGASIDDVRRGSKLYALRTLHAISTKYGRTPEAGTALRTILSAAELMRAKACVVVSPESTTVQPDWIQRLLRPVYNEHFDLVTPVYRRHMFEGLLMSNLLYPMMRAIYGVKVREPYASEFAFSGRLAGELVGRSIWSEESVRTSAEMSFTLAAITGGFRIHQVFLGDKSHTEHRASDLVAAIRRTVGTLFWTMGKNPADWMSAAGLQPLSTEGPEYELRVDPVRVNRKRLWQLFSAAVTDLEAVLRSVLSAATLSELQRIAKLEEDDFRYPADLWAQTVYEFADSYHKSVIDRDHILQALAPLFRGRIFTFLIENCNGTSAEEVENSVEALCFEFEKLKPYLVEMWRREVRIS